MISHLFTVHEQWLKQTALHIAVIHENVDIVQLILDKPDVNINLQTDVCNYDIFYNCFDIMILLFISISYQIKLNNII